MKKLLLIFTMLAFSSTQLEAGQTTLKVAVDATMDGNAANSTGEDWRLTDFENWSKQHGMNTELYNYQGPWVTLKAYIVDQFVNTGGNIYVCLTNHTSGTFATDLAAARWKFWGSDIYAPLAVSTVRTTAGGGSTTAPPSEVAVGDALAGKVGTTGNETIAGVKTFSSSPIIPAPTTDLQAATKKYVDDNGGAGATAIDDLTDVDTTGKATGKVLKFDASGNMVVGDDEIGAAGTGDITGVTAGTGLTGGGDTGAVTVGLSQATQDAIAANTAKVSFDSTSSARLANTSGTNTGDQTLPVGGTPAITLGTTSTAGSSPNFLRRDDTILVFDATSPATQAFGDAAAVGTATVAARRDHKHAMMAAPTTVSGNAGSATVLQTARTINGQSFNGSANITIPATGIPIVDAGGYLTGTELEAVLQEIAAKIPTGVDGNRGLKVTENTIDYSAEEAGYFVYTSKSGVPHYYGGTTDYTLVTGTSGVAAGNILVLPSDPAAHTLFGFDNTTNTYKNILIGANLSFDQPTNTLSASASSGMTNPMTATGDMIKGGAAGAPTRMVPGTGAVGAIEANINGTGGITTPDGSATLTNKTMNTASTGNDITVPLNGVLDGAITDPADADDMIYKKVQNAMTLTDIHCLAEGGGTITLTLQECTTAGASCANIEGAITCDADGAEDDGTLTDGAIAAGAWIKVLYSAPTGTVTNLAWTVYGTQTW